MPIALPQGRQYFEATGGGPGVGYRLYAYIPGTSTPKDTYTTSVGNVANTHPVVMDARGEAAIYWDGAYDVSLYDANNALVWGPERLEDASSDLEERLADETGVATGADLVGFDSATIYPPARTVAWWMQFNQHHIFEVIPTAEHAAILAYTSTYVMDTEINNAIEDWEVVLLPAGRMRTRLPINHSARRHASNSWNRHLIGKGSGATQIDAYTGNYPCIDSTGQNTGSIIGINFRSDNPPSGLAASDCASIGLMMGRGNVSQSCNQLYVCDVRFNLTSDMTRNAGNGTIGILNNGAEHVIRDQIQIYANLPLCDQNGLQFTPYYSRDIATYGANYEEPYAGSVISCTIHESRNMQLIAWDSFRAMWLHQVAGVSFPNLYTSTRFLVDTTPSQAETIYMTGSCANVFIDCYQEVSGLFGATYRMDHRYLTLGGDNESLNITIQRGVNDYGFTNPGVSASSVHLLDAAYLANSNINCNYTIGIYNDSTDNNGFAALPVTFAGTPNGIVNVDFTLDHSGSHSANIFSAIGAYCTNVKSINYYGGDTYYQSDAYIENLKYSPVSAALTLGEVFSTAAGFTLNTGFPAGWEAGVYNNSAAPITITEGAGLTLRLAGTATTGNRTIAQRGRARIWFLNTGEAVMDGAGVT